MGNFDPIRHQFTIKADRVKELIALGAQVSERVAKLMFKETGDDLYKKFFTFRESTSKTKNPDKYS